MMKKITMVALGAWCALAAMAVPAKPGSRVVTQPDGSTLTLRRVGDEKTHALLTIDGKAVARDASGQFCYRLPDGSLSGVVAHDPNLRGNAELSFLNSNPAVTFEQVAAKASARRAARRAPAKAPSQVPHLGNAKIPVLLVQYKDYKFRDGANAKTTFENWFNGSGVSAKQYFVDQSNGKYTPQFDIYGPITLNNNRAYYGGNDYYTDEDLRPGQMVGEACTGLNSQINFSNYDNDGDGECDVVIVLYAGDGEASSFEDDCADSIWPHQWELSGSDYGKALTLDGVRVDKYACFNELYGMDLSKLDGIGCVAHEFSHCLGLPDFYDVNYKNNFGMGPWSLLDSGCYNDEGFTPIGYSGYEKEFMGWVTLQTPTANTHYTLPVWNSKDAAKDIAYKLVSSANPNEYFVLENRQRQGWDKYMVADGMMITHVSYKQSAWDNNEVNTSSPNLMTPVPADNALKLDYSKDYDYYSPNEESLLGDLWPYKNSTEFTDTSAPAAKLNLTSGKLGKPVTEITRNADGTISFMFMKAALPALSTPVLTQPTDICADGFTANWTHADAPAGTTYTLEVTPYVESASTEIHHAVFPDDFSDNKVWTSTSGYVGKDDNFPDGIKLGSAKQGGAMTSPALDAQGAEKVTVVVTACSYNTASSNDNSSMKVSTLNAAGTSLGNAIQALDKNYATYSFTLPAAASGNTKVKLETTTSAKGRFVVSEVYVYTGEYNPMAVRRAAATPLVYTGITGHSYTVSNLVGESFKYRVKAVATDSNANTDSDWTPAEIVVLAESGVADIYTNTPAQYFTLQGVRVNEHQLTPGLYIVRQGAKTSKILVK